MKPVSLGLVTLLLGGCALFSSFSRADPPLPDAEGDSCNAAARADLIGSDADALMAIAFDQPVRVVPEDGFVVLDFQADRINFEIDDRERIVRIFCG